MIKAVEANLQRGIQLLNCISNDEYCDKTIAPYYSSIGGHMRHILDVFDCVFDGLETEEINLINRKRNQLVENYTKSGIIYFEDIIEKLHKLKTEDFETMINVTDDLGLGAVTIKTTLIGMLMQAHSHAIHHFAIVAHIISQLGIQLPDDDFGFNPTTPR